jgi:hypothetical protein
MSLSDLRDEGVARCAVHPGQAHERQHRVEWSSLKMKGSGRPCAAGYFLNATSRIDPPKSVNVTSTKLFPRRRDGRAGVLGLRGRERRLARPLACGARRGLRRGLLLLTSC